MRWTARLHWFFYGYHNEFDFRNEKKAQIGEYRAAAVTKNFAQQKQTEAALGHGNFSHSGSSVGLGNQISLPASFSGYSRWDPLPPKSRGSIAEGGWRAVEPDSLDSDFQFQVSLFPNNDAAAVFVEGGPGLRVSAMGSSKTSIFRENDSKIGELGAAYPNTFVNNTESWKENAERDYRILNYWNYTELEKVPNLYNEHVFATYGGVPATLRSMLEEAKPASEGHNNTKTDSEAEADVVSVKRTGEDYNINFSGISGKSGLSGFSNNGVSPDGLPDGDWQDFPNEARGTGHLLSPRLANYFLYAGSSADTSGLLGPQATLAAESSQLINGEETTAEVSHSPDNNSMLTDDLDNSLAPNFGGSTSDSPAARSPEFRLTSYHRSVLSMRSQEHPFRHPLLTISASANQLARNHDRETALGLDVGLRTWFSEQLLLGPYTKQLLSTGMTQGTMVRRASPTAEEAAGAAMMGIGNGSGGLRNGEIGLAGSKSSRLAMPSLSQNIQQDSSAEYDTKSSNVPRNENYSGTVAGSKKSHLRMLDTGKSELSQLAKPSHLAGQITTTQTSGTEQFSPRLSASEIVPGADDTEFDSGQERYALDVVKFAPLLIAESDAELDSEITKTNTNQDYERIYRVSQTSQIAQLLETIERFGPRWFSGPKPVLFTYYTLLMDPLGLFEQLAADATGSSSDDDKNITSTCSKTSF